VLFTIDQERYKLALATAEAAFAAAHAQYLMLLDQYQRRLKLSPGVTITIENLDNARRQSETAEANHQQAIASRDTAALTSSELKCARQSTVSSPTSILPRARMPRRGRP